MKQALILGSGQRVRESALPAFMAARDHLRLAGIFSRKAKRIETPAGDAFDVAPLDDLDAATLAAADVLYMVVSKDAVPSVLRKLRAHDCSRLDLLIETPVLRFKHLGYRGLLEGFRNVWVTEDTIALPVHDAVDAFREQRGLGPIVRATLDRSGYAYHGLAIGRHLLAARGEGYGRVRSGRRRGNTRSVRFEGDGELTVIEPRDYRVGRVRLECAGASISDDPGAGADHTLAAVVDGGACTGFRVDDVVVELSPAERLLMGAPLGDEGGRALDGGVTLWMEGMKRVGFLRLLERVAADRGAYPLDAAIEDTVVDYHLEKLGRYAVNPLTSPHLGSSRLVLGALRLFARA